MLLGPMHARRFWKVALHFLCTALHFALHPPQQRPPHTGLNDRVLAKRPHGVRLTPAIAGTEGVVQMAVKLQVEHTSRQLRPTATGRTPFGDYGVWALHRCRCPPTGGDMQRQLRASAAACTQVAHARERKNSMPSTHPSSRVCSSSEMQNSSSRWAPCVSSESFLSAAAWRSRAVLSNSALISLARGTLRA